MTSDEHASFRAGLVAIIGRANVGKSTLLNALLGQKLAIVSPKPHTTRHKLLGVLNGEGFQAALLDTPGFLRHGRDQMDAAMSRALASALADADLALLVAEPRRPGDVELGFIEQLARTRTQAILVLNKVDTVAKTKLLPVIQAYTEAHPFLDIVPVSAEEEDGLELVVEALARHLPPGEEMFPEDQVTDRPVRFLVGELIREKVFHRFEHEIPYDVAVEVEEYEEREGRQPDYVRATVYVDKPSQKAMLIGKGGAALKEVGSEARVEIEELVGRPAYLELWVKVNPKWRRKAGFIQRFV